MEQNINKDREYYIKLIKNNVKKIKTCNLSDALLRECLQFLESLNKLSNKNHTFLIFNFILLLTPFNKLSSQCSPPLISSCNPPSSVVLINNDVVNSGQIKIVNSLASFAGLSINGGTLVVCANLSVTSFTFNSGTIIINPGGIFNLNVGSTTVLGSNCNIYNFGSFNTSNSFVTGPNNTISNSSTSSVFNVPFNQLIIQGPNTQLINFGIINSSFFIVSSNNTTPTICSGIGSFINTGILINQALNSFISPSGQSCINITNQINNSQALTTTSNVNICYLSGNVSIIGSPNFGSATVNNSCSNCSIVLPVEITNFTAECDNQGIKVDWVTASEKNINYFLLLMSLDATNYDDVCIKYSSGNSNQINHYSYIMPSPKNDQVYYFRLKCVELDGGYSLTYISAISCNSLSEIDIYFESTNHIKIASKYLIASIQLIDPLGRIIKNIFCSNKEVIDFDLSYEYSSAFILRIIDSNGKHYHRKILPFN